MEISLQIKVLLITTVVSVVLLLVGILSSDAGVMGNVVILSTFIVAVPQFLMRYEKFKALREMESRFPLFLRDVIESVRSGMPIHQAVIISSNIDYGKLSVEIRKMSNQISWGIPFDRVIDKFADRTKGSMRLNLALRTIRESYMSGGDVIAALESVADTSVILDEAEKEKRSLLSQYVMLMYGISILFIGVVAGINKLMVPIFQTPVPQVSTNQPGGPGEATMQESMLANPCSTCNGFGCSVCGLFQSTCSIFNIKAESISCYYTSLFLFMSVIESICCGLVAGQISEGSAIAGLKHSIIMATVAFGAFNILIRLGIMGV